MSLILFPPFFFVPEVIWIKEGENSPLAAISITQMKAQIVGLALMSKGMVNIRWFGHEQKLTLKCSWRSSAICIYSCIPKWLTQLRIHKNLFFLSSNKIYLSKLASLSVQMYTYHWCKKYVWKYTLKDLLFIVFKRSCAVSFWRTLKIWIGERNQNVESKADKDSCALVWGTLNLLMKA